MTVTESVLQYHIQLDRAERMVKMDKGGHGHSSHLIRYYALIRANGQLKVSYPGRGGQAKTSE